MRVPFAREGTQSASRSPLQCGFMDKLTHTAVGLFLSRIGLGRWSARATPIILIAANLPDADVVTAAGGPLNYLHYHRHITHSLIAMPLVALAAVAIVRCVGRKP